MSNETASQSRNRTDTPRTDAKAGFANFDDAMKGGPGNVVPADFARELERELADALSGTDSLTWQYWRDRARAAESNTPSASHEALARWVLKNLDWSGGNSDENAEFLAAILERAASVPSETKAKWRPVSEKPPCANQYIALIALPDCDEPRVAQRYYSMTDKWDSDYVTHWMPFPEAP